MMNTIWDFNYYCSNLTSCASHIPPNTTDTSEPISSSASCNIFTPFYIQKITKIANNSHTTYIADKEKIYLPYVYIFIYPHKIGPNEKWCNN